jgi:hypothetical protein
MSQNKRFELPAKEITPKDVYMNRRQFLRGLGTASACRHNGTYLRMQQ